MIYWGLTMKSSYKKPKHPLNILKFGYCGGILNTKNNIKQFFRNLKSAYQRIVWGFCEQDTFNLDSYFLELFYQSLTYFSENLHSYPLNFDEKAWKKYLDKMIAHFYNAQEDHRDTWAAIREDEALDKLIEIEDFGIDKGQLVIKPKKRYTEEELKAAQNELYEATKAADKFREQEMHYAIDMLEEVFFSLWD